MRVAYFTAGSAGAGHLVRGIALGRALARAGHRGDYLMFGPRLPFAAAERPDWEVVDIPEERLLNPLTARETELATRLVAWKPDVLVVDMFWAPLRWILPLAGCEAWLLLRSFPEVWLRGPTEAPFNFMQYARIVAIEPIASPVFTHVVEPVVVANPDERQPRGALRRKLGVTDETRLVAIMHAGNRGEHEKLGRASARGETVVALDLYDRDALFPVAEWIGDADEIHCSAGYNSFWEAVWLGHAKRTTFTTFTRPIDDQKRRVGLRRYAMGSNGADTLANWITRG